MGCKFRAVRLRANTEGGDLGFTTRFDAPMTVIRGGNTIGKSLLVQSMLYALGLETLYATRKGTLTRAMTSEITVADSVDRNADDRSVPVVSSWIEAVIVFNDDKVFTLRRTVKPSPLIPHEDDLVRMWPGDVFDSELSVRGPSDDYLIGRPGSAVQDRGFHRRLAELLGWRLPPVPSYNGRLVPLYLQEMFGLAYVDQKRGWGGTVPQVPTTFQIIDPLRKAVEFVLELDVLNTSVRRQELAERERRLSADITRLRSRLEAAASLHGGRLTYRADTTSQESSQQTPILEILSEGNWVDLKQRIENLREDQSVRSRQRTSTSLTTSSGHAAELEADLCEAEEKLRESSATLAAINQNDEDLNVQFGALGRRLDALDEEYERYRQINALRDLGSVIAPHTMEEGDCPTCHQSLEAVESIENNALPIAATLDTLRSDRATVRSMNEEVEARSVRVAALQSGWTEQVAIARQRVRALKTDLVAASGAPSARDIQEVLEQEHELAKLLNLQAHSGEDIDNLQAHSSELASVSAELKGLNKESQSASDKGRIQKWTSEFRRLLGIFKFTSAAPDEVDLDTTMRPVVDGYDIGFQGSASDGIRLRWSYLLSLASVSADSQGSHPGLLILDEPAQQGIEADSVVTLLGVLASMSTSTQMFITTSEPPARLAEWLGDTKYQLIDLGDERLLKLLEME